MQKRIKEITEKEALKKLGALCSRSEHCTFEMQEKMTRWGLDEKAQARVIAELVKGKFVDDERFARAFANDKARYNKWGRRKIDQALYMKHIDEDIRRKVLDEIDGEVYNSSLRPLLEAKLKSTKAKSDYELMCKLLRFAIGRGYDIEEARSCIEDIVRALPDSK